jgi:hypothetical protein
MYPSSKRLSAAERNKKSNGEPNLKCGVRVGYVHVQKMIFLIPV